ncbi:MAG: transketolase, partial [Mycolicibacterium frederiksbergense]|nr:transketolase [Mycolicibacterium frederiksbergense]
MTTVDEITALTRPNHPDDWTALDSAAVDTVRVLAADAVQKVGNGHPGTAMSLAPLAYTLFQRQMRHNPSDNHWIGRDRFVLSVGHSSLTLYIQLYLGGFGLELSDIESLRTWKSKTPGHPEFRHTKGVEITTGPLGQGLASAVGMAMASRYERGLFDPDAAPGTSPFDHYIYVIASDGDIEEGVTSEASSLAGTQQLGNLIVFYDSNQISIEDDTNIALAEDTPARYRAYGWHVQEVEGGENVVGIEAAIAEAKRVTDKPSFIAIRTIIGYPAPNLMNTGKAHGAALGDEEVSEVKKILGFDPDKAFEVRDEVIEHTRKLVARGTEAHEKWHSEFDTWAQRQPERKALLDRLTANKLPDRWDADLPHWSVDDKPLATRAAFGQALNAVAPKLPELWGGSADLAGSNNTTIKGVPSFGPPSISTKEFTADWYGRVLHFGVREHAMGSILSGIVLHGPTRAFGGTFLQFSDYMRAAVRLASLMNIDTIYIWTHDSIGLGEDGPTHQPIEHLAALRAIPNLSVVRPGDPNETAYAWRTIIERGASSGPVGFILTRQPIPVLEGTSAEGVAKGGYVLG